LKTGGTEEKYSNGQRGHRLLATHKPPERGARGTKDTIRRGGEVLQGQTKIRKKVDAEEKVV